MNGPRRLARWQLQFLCAPLRPLRFGSLQLPFFVSSVSSVVKLFSSSSAILCALRGSIHHGTGRCTSGERPGSRQAREEVAEDPLGHPPDDVLQVT